MTSFQSFVPFARLLAKKSAELILPYFHSDLKVEDKADHSPVTKADKMAEKLMREMISKNFPDHGIIGEEFGKANEKAEFVWVLDPIDGTKSFICGVPLFGTLIALLKDGLPILGVIHLPALKELYIGVKGEGTTLNGTKIKVRKTKELSEAVLLCTDHLDVINHQNEASFLKLAKQVKFYRNWGDCYMYTLLARGAVDIAIDPVMNYWDIQALIPVIEGAGGIITDYQGHPASQATSTVASNPYLHSKVIQCLNLKLQKKA